MIGLLDKLASAVARQEGWFAHLAKPDLPQVDLNPGDLRAAPWLANAVIVGGFWNAASASQGIGGLYHQIALDIGRGMTLRQLLHSWAPALDGNAEPVYLANVMKWTGLTEPDIALWNFLELTDPEPPK